MSKIICEICGTSYPETAKQCPICGYVRAGDVHRVTNEVKSDGNVSTGYTQVKGGHFSKSNVKKRTKDTGAAPSKKRNEAPRNTESDRESRGLVIVAIILLLAVIGVVIYIAVRFFGPISNPNDGSQPTGIVQNIACTGITLDTDTLTFDEAGEMLLLNVTVQPKNTTDLISYHSEDKSVVTVNSVGKVTVVGEGATNIVITCGKVTKVCAVTVQFPEDSTGVDSTENTASESTGESVNTTEELRLNRKDITFTSKGSSWNLYDGTLPRNQIKWTSDDVSVASFTDGVVMAVGNGTTTVHAEYGNQKISCTIRCTFKDNGGIAGNGGVSEDGGGSSTSSVTGRVNVEGLYVRSGPGTGNDWVTLLPLGQVVTILEQTTVDGNKWGRINEGWICLVNNGETYVVIG